MITLGVMDLVSVAVSVVVAIAMLAVLSTALWLPGFFHRRELLRLYHGRLYLLDETATAIRNLRRSIELQASYFVGTEQEQWVREKTDNVIHELDALLTQTLHIRDLVVLSMERR